MSSGRSQNESNGETTVESTRESNDGNPSKPSNEYVLNIAFYSFIGFVAVQTVFALIANSQSMLADSEAMAVDAFTYLFNLGAEHLKKQPVRGCDDGSSEEMRSFLIERRRLWLELVPPTISVMTLLAITVITTREAVNTLFLETKNDQGDDNVSISIMLWFSGANLVLDIVNVTCFARANSMFGLDFLTKENAELRRSIVECDGVLDESTSLIPKQVHDHTVPCTIHGHHQLLNMNMCSAWTHICADTMRSVSVLVAAGLATIIPAIPPSTADSVAAIAVSVIIFVSLVPLFQGLVYTGLELRILCKNPPQSLSV